jgi:hypothetical protein
MWLSPCEVEVGRKPALGADEHFPQASPALEGQPIQNAAFGQKLKQKGQHHFLLCDHYVARPGFIGVALHLRLHEQFDRMIGTTRVVNAGSVGMPFGEPGADWLLLAPDVQLRHTRYDLARAADRIRSGTYAQAEDFAARNVLHPPSEEETFAAFTPAELK